jgi:hypothetical protein
MVDLTTTDIIERLRGSSIVFMTIEQGTMFLNEVANKIEELQGQLIWGFYEEEIPEYTQGSEKLHELHELVTAEECNGLVKTIKETRERGAELEKTSEYWMGEATAGIDGAKARITWKDRAKAADDEKWRLRIVLEKVKQCCLFTDDYSGGIGVTTDPNIPSELFDEICTVLPTPPRPAGNGD